MRYFFNQTVIIGILFFVFGSRSAGSQEYRWPTDASRYLTSTFGEYRPRHLHAGIDIKTWGREGYGVYAVGSGYIWRIKVSPYGYGKALYLKLHTGETVVYAHLRRFADKIQKIVEEEQERTEKFSIDKYFSSSALPIAQGECIAYTGRSGAKAPHLHFELRDKSNSPINPLAKGFFIRDSIAPTVTRMSISPLDSGSQVNGEFEPKVLDVFEVGSGQYILKDTVQVWGKIAIGVSAYDRADGVYNQFSVYKTELYVDESLIFAREYERFSYSITEQVELDREYRLQRWGWGLFYKLFREPENDLPFYGTFDYGAGILKNNDTSLGHYTYRPAWSGIRGKDYSLEEGVSLLSSGYHTILVKAYDFYGNQSNLRATILMNKKPEIKLITAEKEDVKGHVAEIGSDLAIEADKPIEMVRLRVSENGGWNWTEITINREDLLPKTKVDGNASLSSSPLYVFPDASDTNSFWKGIVEITATDSFGTSSFPVYKFLGMSFQRGTEGLKLSVKKLFFDNYVELRLFFNNPLEEPPCVLLAGINGLNQQVKMYPKDIREFVGVFPLYEETDEFITMEISARDCFGEEKIFYDQLEIQKIFPDEGGTIVSWDNNCRIYFGRNSVYRPLFGRIEPTDIENRWDYDLPTRIYSVEPFDVPLNKRVWVEIQYPVDDPSPDKLGVYFLDDSGEWEFLGNFIDNSKKTVGAPALSLEKFSLIRDVDPPEIPWVFPRHKSRIRDPYVAIKASVKDQLSGIGSEEDIVVMLDGKKLIVEYDPERDQVFYEMKKPLNLGKHRLFIWVQDRSNNIAKKLIEFWVVR